MWPFSRRQKSKTVTVKVDFGSSREHEAYALYGKRYPALDRHFKLIERLENTYTPSSEQAVQKSIKICRDMIAMSKEVKAAWMEQDENQAEASKMLGDRVHKRSPLPTHPGFRQYAIILEKRGELAKAIQIAKHARAEGWHGDWDKRITRCEAKIAKAQASSKRSR